MFKHLQESGLTYVAHQKQAFKYYLRLQLCATKVLIHSIYPDLFIKDASDEICRLHKEMHGEKKNT